jgi:hypothetical protein
MRWTVPVLLPLLSALPARAQSINVDFESANTPYGRPTPNYRGSGGAAGVWNSVSTVSASGLRSWDGAPTGVSVVLDDPLEGCTLPGGAGPFFAYDVPGTSGENESLLDDRYSPFNFVISCTFQGLAPGDYVVDTSLVALCQTHTEISVVGSPDPPVMPTGVWSGSFVEGESFVRHRKTVTDGTIRINFDVQGHVTDYMFLSGIQLNMGEQELPGVPLCFGDGSAAACPCANPGREARGCQNSASTGGAVLFATGTTSPDTVVLHASGELPSALSIFLQGNASITPVIYGDGLRCAGGTLRRLYTKTANGGEATAPEPGDPSITVRSAALGVPIPSEGRRYYQVYYRDANPSFCPSPQGSTFNVSSAVRINW